MDNACYRTLKLFTTLFRIENRDKESRTRDFAHPRWGILAKKVEIKFSKSVLLFPPSRPRVIFNSTEFRRVFEYKCKRVTGKLESTQPRIYIYKCIYNFFDLVEFLQTFQQLKKIMLIPYITIIQFDNWLNGINALFTPYIKILYKL